MLLVRPWSVRIGKKLCPLSRVRPEASGRTRDLGHSFSQYGHPSRWITYIYFMTSYPSGQAGAILTAWDSIFCCFIPYNKFFIDQACSVKIAGYWPRSLFFSCLWTETKNTQKKNLASIQPSWPHTCSITHMYVNTSLFFFVSDVLWKIDSSFSSKHGKKQ